MIKQVAIAKLESAITRASKRTLIEVISYKHEPMRASTEISHAKTNPREISIIKVIDSSVKEQPLSASFNVTSKNTLTLPPIVSKKDLQTSLQTIFETNDNTKDAPLPKEKRSDKAGFLLIGDAITLLSKDSNEDFEFTGVISGDGISHVHLECIPKEFFTEFSNQVLFRQSLFRIEPSRQYGFTTMLQNYKKLKKQDPKVLKRLKEQADEEQKGNEAELDLSYGRKVTYGERIQLRHLHSDCFLTASLEVARERGCLQVILDHKGSEGSWFEIMPKDKLRQEGEPVKYSDFFKLVTTMENSTYHLHMAISQIFRQNMECELNASSNLSIWRARKFISQSQMKINPNFVATGDSFRIFHKQCEGYLSVTPRKIEEILPNETTEAQQEGNEEVYAVNYKIRSEATKEPKMKVYIENNKSSLSVWELERKNPFIGGLAEPVGEYRIKHVATGMFLYVAKSGQLSLTTDGSNDHTLFKILPENYDSPYLTFKTLVKFENIKLQKVLKAGGQETLKNFFQTMKTVEEMEVKLTFNRKLATKTTFILEDEPEESTIHIYQISRVIPKLVSFYYFLSTWGMVKRNVAYILNYELARSTEAELERQSEMLVEIMNNLRKRILKDDPSMMSNLVDRQDAIRQSGLLDLIIKIVQLIESRLTLPLKFPKESMPKAIRRSNVKMLNEIVKLQIQEYLNTPQVVGVKHLYKLAVKLYETIFLCIKNNAQSCQSLKVYDEFLSSQLSSYKLQVGVILKESFKYSVDIFSKATPEQFRNWIEQIKPINELEDNIEEQVITFKILASLCVHNDRGVPKYQTIIEKELFSRESKLVQFLLSDGRPCIKIFQDSNASVREFMLNNPTLQKISVPQDPEAPMPNLFFISSFTPHPFLVGYISSILELLASMCMSRNESSAQKVIKEMNLTFEHIFSCMSNPNVHSKLRKNYTALCRIIYIDRDPLVSLTDCTNRTFFWNSTENRIEDERDTPSTEVISSIKRLDNSSVPIAALAQWLEELWKAPKNPFSDDGEETRNQKISFVIEIIELSKWIVSLQYVSYFFVNEITGPLIKLIDHNKYDSKEFENTNLHWCSELKNNLKPFGKEESRQDNLAIAVLSFFQVAYAMRTNKQVYEVLKMLEDVDRTNNAEMMDTIKQSISKFNHTNYQKALKRHKRNRSVDIMVTSKTPLLFMKNRIAPDSANHTSDSIVNELNDSLNFDAMLLNLLFNNFNKTIKQKSLELILFNFNQNSILHDALSETCLLPSGPLRDIYQRMKFIILKINYYAKKIKLLTDTFDVKTGIKEDQEIRKIKTNTKNNVDELEHIIFKKGDSNQMSFLQKMAKSLGAHNALLKFLKDDWVWISITPEGNSKLDPAYQDLYRSIFGALTAFCYKNYKNQMLLYDSVKLIVNFLGNLVGATRVLAEVISCKRNSQTGGLIIQHMFKSMESRENPLERPQDIRVMKALLYDENHHFYAISQTHVIKALLNTKKLYSIFSCETGWDLSKYTAENLKFYANMILLLASSAVHNPFTTQQCRRLIPYQILFKELRSSALHLKIKRAYLHYFFYVYCMTSDGIVREIPGPVLEELLYRVVLPDFEMYTNYFVHMPVLCRKSLYKIIMPQGIKIDTQKSLPKGKQLMINLIANFTPSSKKFQKQFDDLTKEQVEALDYWKYISSRMPYTPNIGTGLLCFIKDLSIELKSSGDVPSPETVEILEEIRSELQALHDSLFDLKFEHEDLNVDFFIKEVREASLEIPYYIIETGDGVPVHKGEEESFRFMLDKLQNYVMHNNLPLEEFFAKELEITDDANLDRNEFISKVKWFIRKDIRTSQIDGAINFMDPDGGEIINVYLLVQEMKEFFIGNKYVVKKKRNPEKEVFKEEPEDINKVLEGVLAEMHKENQQSTTELKGLIRKVKKSLFDEALIKKDYTSLLKFMNNLESAFQKKEHKIYLLEMFKYMLIFQEEAGGDGADKTQKIKTIQNLFADGGIIQMAISLINRENDTQLIRQAFELLNKLLEHNNLYIKQKLLEYLKTSGATFELFTFIKVQLRITRDYFMDYQKKKEMNEELKRKLSSMKTFLPDYIPQAVQDFPKRTKDTDLTIIILLFLQLCCDNCYLPFQDYLREQNDLNIKVSIDLVTELGQFIINMVGLKELKSLDDDMTPACKAVQQCLWTLADVCSGPCASNQLLLGQRRRLYKFMNWIIGFPEVVVKKPSAWLQIFSASVKFLNSLIEGNLNRKVSKIFFEEISTENLVQHATLIWKDLVAGREDIIYQDDKGKSYWWLRLLELSGKKLESFEKNVIETGFDIYILILSLRKAHKDQLKKKSEYKSSKINLDPMDFFKYDHKQEITINHNEDAEVQNFKSLFGSFFKRFSGIFHRRGIVNATVVDMQNAYRFYSSNIASVEINNKGTLAKIYFRVPNQCRFLTVKSRNELLHKVSRNSYQEKIDDFINRSRLYEVEMYHQQKLARYPFLDDMCCNWRLYGKISYGAVILLNIIIFFTAAHEGNSQTGKWVYNTSDSVANFITALSVLQIILAFMIFVCYIIEYFPVIVYQQKSETKSKQMVEYIYNSRFEKIHGTVLMKEIISRTQDKLKISIYPLLDDLLTVATNEECIYNFIYLVISILSMVFHICYALLLLDIVKRNPDLSNVLKSITLNYKQLLKTVALGVIVIYLFSIIAFLNFSLNYGEDVNNSNANTYCDNLWECFESTLISGIRAGGGIGDDLRESPRGDKNYWWLMIFNLLYFIFVIIILLNIIFGIIIDTFGELRDEKQEMQRDIENNCFICGNGKFQFEIKRIGWLYHIQIEHNIHAYLAFLVYIHHKNLEECTGAEKYVKELMEKNDINFFPRSSISLEEKDESDDEQVSKYKIIEKKLKKINEAVKKIK
ncbi:unnamed protein product [Blepharisma stoltei]|uniref:MIR domain-containing protein n=1 Tax=Blepharisma stoltei TaxID=1481888 RepID=A0AAU9J864_9CILI|nr:unnamed protein product [Blepharisma stoltei]